MPFPLLKCLAAALFVLPGAVSLRNVNVGKGQDAYLGTYLGTYEPDEVFQKRGLSFTVSTNQTVRGDYAHNVSVSLKNGGNQTLAVLRFGSPFENEILNNIFKTEPKTSTYLGRIMSRQLSAIRNEDLAILEPGQELSSTFDMRKYLAFQSTGNYQLNISFNLMFLELPPGRNKLDISAQNRKTYQTIQHPISAGLPINVHAITTLQEVQQVFMHHPKEKAGSCSTKQMSFIASATENAEKMARKALSHLSAHDDREHWAQWFGESDSAPAWESKVVQIFEKLHHDVLDPATGTGFIPDCTTCKAEESANVYNNAFAYVHPHDQTKTLFFCGMFWDSTLDMTRDSGPGTILHELTHFKSIGDTEDVVFGTAALEKLAKEYPTHTRTNADSFEAYAETS